MWDTLPTCRCKKRPLLDVAPPRRPRPRPIILDFISLIIRGSKCLALVAPPTPPLCPCPPTKPHVTGRTNEPPPGFVAPPSTHRRPRLYSVHCTVAWKVATSCAGLGAGAGDNSHLAAHDLVGGLIDASRRCARLRKAISDTKLAGLIVERGDY